jgi:ubiquinone/menaquinone biosynthesis C-methylase UbiE
MIGPAPRDTSRFQIFMTNEKSIKSFWEEAAKNNPHWYISSCGDYNATRDLDKFWESGRAIWADIKAATAFTPTPTATVVEIGCGIGRLTRAIAPEVGRVIALDISEKMLEMARSGNLPNVDFRAAQGFALTGIPDDSVDLCLAYCVFQHLPSHEALKSYLAEMARVTKPGSLVAFTLSPRDWSAWMLPIFRAKAFFREHLSKNGPKGTYRKEWIGIRPSPAVVADISPIKLQRRELGSGRTLYYGLKKSC